MAEFTEVMKQAKRMCEYYEDGRCRECPLSRDNTKCGHSLCIEISSISAEEAAEIEHAVMSWAAEHPAPRYPTWREWQKNVFPDAGDDMYPCNFLSYTECKCKGSSCDECRDRSIPADIAAKLGIRPMAESCGECDRECPCPTCEGENWEEARDDG